MSQIGTPENEFEPLALTGGEVRRRAGVGVAAVAIRQVAIRLLGLGGTAVLTRLLLPADFGAIAFGATMVTVFGFATDAGIGAGLIRGSRAPDRHDLQSFLGLQLALTSLLALAAVAIGWPFGTVGRVTAVMLLSLPLGVFRNPAVVLYERSLNYQPLAVAEVVQTIAYYVWAIGTVLLGWGVWGLATATVFRVATGTLLITMRSPAGFLLPRLDWGRLRPLLRFGLQYQAVGGVVLVRDQGVNLGTAAIGGIGTLGLWSLAYGIMQAPFLLFDSVWRVSFPAMARFIAAGEQPGPIIERGLRLAALITGGMLALLVGSTPSLVPSIFGAHWAAAGAVIPWAALGLMFAGPISVATIGYLYAIGDSFSALLAAMVQTIAWLLVAFALLPILGVEALGIGWFASSIAEGVILSWRTRRHLRVAILRHVAYPAALAAVASTAGWLVAASLSPTLTATILGAGVAGAVYTLGVLLFRRQLLLEAIRLGLRSTRALAK